MQSAELPLLLLVEDDDLDALIVRRCLRELQIPCELIHETDAEQALTHLIARSSDLPCAILLDLNMPRMDGLEFLCHVKSHPRLKDIPVLIVSTSTSELDISKSLELGAARYIVKNINMNRFKEDLKCLQRHCDLATEALISS